TTISPINQARIISKSFNTINEFNESIQKAKASFRSWKFTKLQQRIEILKRFSGLCQIKRGLWARELVLQIGRPISQTEGELDYINSQVDFLSDLVLKKMDPIQLNKNNASLRRIKREPLGVGLLISPWNYPYNTTLSCLIPSILAGNTVLLKPSPQSPLVADNIVNTLKEAGLPENVVQILHLDEEGFKHAVAHPQIDYINFTGSLANGCLIQNLNRLDKFINLNLELGGKDGFYFSEDADLETYTPVAIRGAMDANGQSCSSVERIYVHESVYDKFLCIAKNTIKSLKLGNPNLPETDVGPVISLTSADYIKRQIDDAIDKGAQHLVDPNYFTQSIQGPNYIPPQVLINCSHNMSIMTKETFGPVVGVMKVKSDDQAVCLINDSEYGLTGGIFTQNKERAENFLSKLEVGTALCNTCNDTEYYLPWTGTKKSGNGVSMSEFAFDRVTRLKA
ncbi:ALDH-like protein, partial [Conidiobolus coronatus NRRL 28638]